MDCCDIMSRLVKGLFAALFFVLFSGTLWGQVVNTESPYSHYGLGDPSYGGYLKPFSMGGISQGLRDPNMMNPGNPASYTSQDSMSFIFDMAFSGAFTRYASAGGRKDNVSGNVHHLAMQFPVGKYLGMAIGFQPYSQVGYDVTRYEEDLNVLAAVGRVRYHHRGNGGLNEAFLGIAGEPFSFFSLGVNVRFLFGSLNFAQDVHVPSPMYYAELRHSSRLVVRGVALSAGVQGIIPLGVEGGRQLVLGGTVDLAPYVRSDNRLEVTQVFQNREQAIERNYLRSTGEIALPLRYAAGFLYRDSRISAGVDFTAQDWSAFTMQGVDQGMGSSFSVRGGVEYVPDAGNLRYYLRQVHYRLGGYFNRTGLMVLGKPVNDFGITLGAGFPFKRSGSMFQVAFNFGQRGQLTEGLIRENYFGMTFGVSFNDIWFFRRKYN